ncbi:hypothetical protein ABEB36_007519 [Hypothenemus hampei]|uniref:Uncharacterized protein n=1 Tax=Hypothenemus hampei TaxID=57062 RepID=A0ABD1EY96_HYPHA
MPPMAEELRIGIFSNQSKINSNEIAHPRPRGSEINLKWIPPLFGCKPTKPADPHFSRANLPLRLIERTFSSVDLATIVHRLRNCRHCARMSSFLCCCRELKRDLAYIRIGGFQKAQVRTYARGVWIILDVVL